MDGAGVIHDSITGVFVDYPAWSANEPFKVHAAGFVQVDARASNTGAEAKLWRDVEYQRDDADGGHGIDTPTRGCTDV